MTERITDDLRGQADMDQTEKSNEAIKSLVPNAAGLEYRTRFNPEFDGNREFYARVTMADSSILEIGETEINEEIDRLGL